MGQPTQRVTALAPQAGRAPGRAPQPTCARRPVTYLTLCSTSVISATIASAGASLSRASAFASCAQEASPLTCTPDARLTPAQVRGEDRKGVQRVVPLGRHRARRPLGLTAACARPPVPSPPCTASSSCHLLPGRSSPRSCTVEAGRQSGRRYVLGRALQRGWEGRDERAGLPCNWPGASCPPHHRQPSDVKRPPPPPKPRQLTTGSLPPQAAARTAPGLPA